MLVVTILETVHLVRLHVLHILQRVLAIGMVRAIDRVNAKAQVHSLTGLDSTLSATLALSGRPTVVGSFRGRRVLFEKGQALARVTLSASVLGQTVAHSLATHQGTQGQ